MDPERRLRNKTLAAARALTTTDRHGREIALVVVKLTLYAGSDGRVLLPIQRAIRMVDEQLDPNRPSSIRYPSDTAPEKPGTDVLLVGRAHPPAGREVTEMVVGIRVGPVARAIRVCGTRRWKSGRRLSAAEPLAPTPLVYELAYGGIDETDPARPLIDTRNPLGRGVARDHARLVGELAPVLEDPGAPFDARTPGVACFAPIAPHWSPRLECIGTLDDGWRRHRAPIAPLDLNPRHYCCAPSGSWSACPLRGDEPFDIVGATPEGYWHFKLGSYRPRFRYVVRGTSHDLASHLDTVLVDAETRRIELTWRAAVPWPRRAAHLELLEVTSEGVLPHGALDDSPEHQHYLAAHRTPAHV